MTTLIPKFDFKNGSVIPTGAVNRPINDKFAESLSVKDFGAVGDGVTDDTAAIQAAINSGVTSITYPKGTYLTNQLTLASNQKHIGLGGILKSSDPTKNMMTGISVSNLSFNNLIFESTGVGVDCISVQGTLSPASNCNNITVDGCSCTGGIQLFNTYQPLGSTYATITGAMLAANIRVVNNSVIGTNASKTSNGLGGISLSFACNSVVSNNFIYLQAQGVYLYGGDGSSPGGDYAITNARKCFNITVSNNVISDIAGGGVVGIMCRDTTVTGNVVEFCTDVGIDFESCFDCVASGNYVLDCNNGALVTYNVMHGILFSGNKCTSSVAGRNIVMHNNTVTPNVADVRDVTYVGNTFECTQSLTGLSDVCFVSDTDVGLVIKNHVQNIICTGNTFINCTIRHLADTFRSASYIGNTFNFPYALGNNRKVIHSENAQDGVTISSNTFNTGQNFAGPAIYVSAYSFANIINNVISNNSIMAHTGTTWGAGIQCYDLAGTTPTRYTVSNNAINAIAPIDATGNTTLRAINNTLADGTPYPTFTPPSTYPTDTWWEVGQIAYSNAPASAGYIGAVCTVAGTTWRPFGEIT